MKHISSLTVMGLPVFFLISLGFSFGLFAQEKPDVQAWGGSRTTAVHVIPLKDEFDQLIVPTLAYPMAYSTRFTCAPCHDYSIIQEGLHFNAISNSSHGRPGEPWVWVDAQTGTVLPLSQRDWEGMWHPRELGLSNWDFTLLFARHMTGGGVNEPPMEEVRPESRWNVSGKLEINCMGCHNASRKQSHSEWAKQVLRQNFRWAATASSGLGEVGGMASRLPGTWDVYDGPNPDDTEWAVVPYVKYDSQRFNSKHQVFFDIAHKLEDQRCLACHSVTPVESPRYMIDEDIHSAAGLKCVDCHRNDITHHMIRGYQGEAEDYQEPARSEFSCEGCHTGGEVSHRGDKEAGRLGAPYPQHPGIPSVHFEKLSCTVCHAGPLLGDDFTRIRTSRANRLGIYGIAQWYTDWPHIIESVYVKGDSGRIFPHRLMWPAFWARLDKEGLVPLKPSEIQEAAGDILAVEESVAQILQTIALYGEIEGIPVLMMAGRGYEPNADGKLDVILYPEKGKPLEEERALSAEEREGPKIIWAIKKEGQISPLFPSFDPYAEFPDSGAEARIRSVLQSLAAMGEAPGEPALVYKKALYKITEGYLEKLDNPEESADTPLLVWLEDREAVPMVSEFQARTIIATVGYEQTLTEEQIGLVLQALSQENKNQADDDDRTYVYVSGGRMFRLHSSGQLEAVRHSAADPVVWPLGHPVRPAQQSLGINGCSDCHSERSPFFFRTVEGTGPLKTQKKARRSALSFMNLDKPYQAFFGLSFRVRPVLKVILFIAALVVGSIVLIMFIIALGKYTGLWEKRR